MSGPSSRVKTSRPHSNTLSSALATTIVAEAGSDVSSARSPKNCPSVRVATFLRSEPCPMKHDACPAFTM